MKTPTRWQEDQEHENNYMLHIRHVGCLVPGAN